MTKATVLHTYYTNEVTEEVLRELRKAPFTEEQLATFDPAVSEELRRNHAEMLSRPVMGIRRIVAEGSQSRLGGKVIKGTSGMTITLDGGVEVAVARKGDPVQYPDGSVSFIATGAGKGHSNIALVGSLLDNGDEIINTSQSACLLVMYEGHVWDSDFLPKDGAEE
ncbi:PAAR domain-containing protein [Pseudomonas sp. NY15181]|uniref:PAAR domain-containing protein n=1 Tax=Pseudomonas sp. NY15181 TaxID=3400349 RepID=UPI003A8BD568